jgi:outer membrane protein TolC
VKIEQQSLELAQQILEVNRALIDAGRLAPVDIVQSETAVANRQVSLLDARNNLEATKLTLLDLLDLDQNIDIESGETLTAQPITLDSNNLRQLAFENRPDYLSAQLNQKTAQLALLLAEDDNRWDLNLITSFNNTLDSSSDLRAGLVLSREFGDLTQEQRFVRSRINLLQAQNTLQDLNDSIKIQVTDGIRDVNLRYSQVELARKATVLSEQQLDIEREKQRLGRGGGIFELVRLQNELADARNAELNATIAYLNALTKLDQTLGTTLDTWQVTVERK